MQYYLPSCGGTLWLIAKARAVGRRTPSQRLARAARGAAALKRDLVTQNAVDPFVETHLLKFRISALPGSAEAVRRNLEELARGTPNYDQMSPGLANVTRAQLPMLQADISKLGAIETVTFNGVGPDGLDVYDVTLDNGAVQCGILVTPDGKIVSAWMRPATAPMPATG